MAWRGKTAFITGGVSGIGFGIARAFSDAGIKLVLSYRNEDYREQAERWFVDQGHEIPRFVKLDVTDRQRFAELAKEIGDIHILVNNAGVSVFGPTDEASYADYDWIMGVNFGGIVNGLVSLLPGMKAHGQGGHIVNVASMAAFCAGPQAGIYTASKFAVRGLTESLRFNLAPYNIGVSLMCPGLTKTNAWDSALRRPDGFSESGFAPLDHQELERFGKAFDLGMDPLEVGEKTLRGIVENRGLILTHPDHREDFEEIYRGMIDALPNEPVPEGRAEIELMRRQANRAAEAGMRIGLDDLT
ncbi:MAG: SDR family oxidoreductase [Sphingomonadales bacterium]|nr:SDR family oxidoreductase [Sphingomonadales bacterium]PIX64597.1 MAG: NAD(P)-dependent oxidoreductase [Sphingomonadales bacterium CG_4_10_14_3_um_filter_58_15]NCO48365.1 SDR family oxidoreductase [Sphingomonadales bacterium]NCO99151.1 SDR family oxidoreductase [Sphingomonadales bacterium]NCP26915.1 SDR family oxidoreductase [Sphingomonadales bacterium]